MGEAKRRGTKEQRTAAAVAARLERERLDKWFHVAKAKAERARRREELRWNHATILYGKRPQPKRKSNVLGRLPIALAMTAMIGGKPITR